MAHESLIEWHERQSKRTSALAMHAETAEVLQAQSDRIDELEALLPLVGATSAGKIAAQLDECHDKAGYGRLTRTAAGTLRGCAARIEVLEATIQKVREATKSRNILELHDALKAAVGLE